MAEKYYLDKDDVLNKLHIAYELARIDQKAAVSTAIADINAISAADVQPVKRGRWENERYDELLECYLATCSECGYESTDHYRITDNHRYCEYCGTRMEEG